MTLESQIFDQKLICFSIENTFKLVYKTAYPSSFELTVANEVLIQVVVATHEFVVVLLARAH